MQQNKLYYGDNLDVLRKYIRDETVDLCYIDPPFNSKRNYNQIYNNIGGEDRAQAQAFIDTWIWDEDANAGYEEILANEQGRFPSQTVDLIKGLHSVLKNGSLLAYLVSMALRITEIHRVLKPTGSFYLHCDPTASHYLKILIDTVFMGYFRNEIVWCYAGGGIPKSDFPRKHDVILRYSKGKTCQYHPIYRPYSEGTVQRGRTAVKGKYFDQGLRAEGTPVNDWWVDVPKLTSPTDPEKLGYPTQKPEALLERIIMASTVEGDVILDAYCGCGTTIAVAERLNRQWVGVDITYQSIALILQRLEDKYGKDVLDTISLSGIPQDMASAKALSLKKDDRVRKEFEKWAVLTYTNNRAIINDKKGGDQGIDGTGYFLTAKRGNAKMVFQVKSGVAGRSDIAAFNNDRLREGAELGFFLTLHPPTQGMIKEASSAGIYHHELMGRHYPHIQIVTITDVIEHQKRLEIPMSLEVIKKSQLAIAVDAQSALFPIADEG